VQLIIQKLKQAPICLKGLGGAIYKVIKLINRQITHIYIYIYIIISCPYNDVFPEFMLFL